MAQNETYETVQGWKVYDDHIANGSQTIYLSSITGVEIQKTRWGVIWLGTFISLILAMMVCSWTLYDAGIIEVVVFFVLFLGGWIVSLNMARERIRVIAGAQRPIPLFKADLATLHKFKSRIELAKQSYANP